MNTAARLQSVAPVGGIAVGEATYRLTKRAFEYEQLEVRAGQGEGGSARDLASARGPRRFGTGLSAEHATPLIGREPELTRLRNAYVTAVAERTPRLVTVVGEPGIGKSRLVSELGEFIDSQPELVRWRQGRCLPYGERNAFWALGEIVKAEAGIWESDSPEEAAAKLEATLPRDDPTGPGCARDRRPCVGARGEPVSQEESFTAWRRLLELWASSRKTVLVFEDLQWANDALLGFLEYLADSPAGSAMFLLCTTRPELYEHHPQFGAKVEKRRANRPRPALGRGDLTPHLRSARARDAARRYTGRVARAYGRQPVVCRGVRSPARGSGPDVRSGRRRPVSRERASADRLPSRPAPRRAKDRAAGRIRGRQGLLGRRDLRDGRAGRVPASRCPWTTCPVGSSSSLQARPRWKGKPSTDSSTPSSGMSATLRFRAPTVRRGTSWLPRGSSGRSRDGTEDVADVLAHHYVHALEVGRAAGQDRDVEGLEASARRYLALAGEQALALDVASAEASLARALELAPAGHQARPGLLERWAQAAIQQGRLQEARSALEEALDAYRAAGESVPAGRTLTELALVLGRLGDPHREDAITEALALLETQPPGPEHVAAYAQLAGRRELDHAFPEAIAAAERALALAAELGLAEPARALGFLGSSRAALGELRGDRRHAPGARPLDRAGQGPRGRRALQQPLSRHVVARGASGRAGHVPRGDRFLQAARESPSSPFAITASA